MFDIVRMFNVQHLMPRIPMNRAIPCDQCEPPRVLNLVVEHTLSLRGSRWTVRLLNVPVKCKEGGMGGWFVRVVTCIFCAGGMSKYSFQA